MRMSSIGFIAGLLSLALGGAAQSQEKITIGLSSTSFAVAPARLAKELGLFERQGLEAEFTVLEGSSTATAAVVSGSLKFALSGPGELVAAQGRGQKVVAIATVYSGSGGTLVLDKETAGKLAVSPDAPASERLKALDDVLVASVTATSSYAISLKAATARNGADVRLTYMGQPAMAAALERGAIQGYIASAPVWAGPVTGGTGVVWISGPKGDFPPDLIPANSVLLQTMADYAVQNPALIEKVAAVFQDFARMVEENPADIKAGLAKLYPDLATETLDLLYSVEANAWKVKPLTAGDMAHEVALARSGGMDLSRLDGVDPATLLFP